MADFLTRLVERSYGAASPVQPLIASIYAPGYAPGLMTMAQADDEQVAELEAPPENNQTNNSKKVDGAPNLASQAKTVLPLQPSRVGASRANSESITADAGRLETEREIGRRSAETTPLHQSLGISPPRGLPETPAVESDARTVVEAVSARPTSRSPIVLHPQLRPLIERTEQQRNAVKEDRAPTIRVTIGRIDVRAIFAPSPPAPRAKPPASSLSPALSLDDYLRSRDKEK